MGTAYRLAILDATGKTLDRFALETTDEATALADAMALAEGRPMELWRGDTLVARTTAQALPGKSVFARWRKP
ncbi:MAG: hypothetical protein JO294_14965 [Alphaproteobacteria bacterium]|nr:hypothetical protein [Alphaproteobacteria bacterium]